MAYTRVNWEDAPSEKTPLNAENLNVMDKGIKDLDDNKLGSNGDASSVSVKFDPASDVSELASGSTLGTLFAKLAKAVSSLISHLTDNKAHSASAITAGTLGGQVKANASAQSTLTTAQLRDAVFVAEASAPAVGSTADTSKFPEGCLIAVVEVV